MNYHFQGRDPVKMNQLQQIERELEYKKKQLQKKKLLESQFYEDSKPRMALADEVMNELFKEGIKEQQHKQQQFIPAHQSPNQVKRPYLSPPKQQQENRFERRQNNFINERELQKIKLQDQQHEGLFPSSDAHNRKRSYERVVAENDRVSPIGINKKYTSPQKEQQFHSNPFTKNQEAKKVQRQNQQKKYLEELKEQLIIEQKRKEEQKKQIKQMKGQFHQIAPQIDNHGKAYKNAESISANARKQQIQEKERSKSPIPKNKSHIHQSDIDFMKIKVDDLKNKYKRGRINFQQYDLQIVKVEKFYNIRIDELENHISQSSKPAQKNIKDELQNESKHTQYRIPSSQRLEAPQTNNMVQPLPLNQNQNRNYSGYHQSHEAQFQGQQSMPINQMGQQAAWQYQQMQSIYGVENFQLMKRMFEQMKELRQMYKESMSRDKQMLHETFTKLLSPTSPLLTQQVPPPIHHSPANKEFYSDAKQYREYFEKQSKIYPPQQSFKKVPHQVMPSSEEQISEYYDKSLSGIVSRVPIKGRKNEITEESKIDAFYEKNYKVKKMKKFVFLKDPQTSEKQVPSVSNFLCSKNAKQQLRRAFEADLNQMRNSQTNKNLKGMKQNMQKNNKYQHSPKKSKQHKARKVSPKKQNNIPEQSAFLKKHVSNDEYNILTFNQKELKMNSPIAPYSPKMKKEILEQEQYQTQPRVKQQFDHTIPEYIQEYESRVGQPAKKMLNVIQSNNQMLKKYEASQNKIEDSNKMFFSNNSISPVKPNQHYEESLVTVKSEIQSIKNKLPSNNQYIVKVNNPMDNSNSFRVSQTVMSVEESSARHRPPICKKRSVGKKKQSSISRSKMDKSANISISKSKFSIQQSEPVKFDSNVYESQYEQSLEIADRKIQQRISASEMVRQDNEREPAEIQMNPPTVMTPKSPSLYKQSNSDEPKASSNNPKSLKSLEEARKLARQFRAKMGQEKDNRSIVEEKMYELQSFLSKKDESISYISIKKEDEVKRKSDEIKKKEKKNIMKMLEQLQQSEQDYNQQFQSYRQSEEQYQP